MRNIVCIIILLLGVACQSNKSTSNDTVKYDLVVLNVRVIDPETKTDAILNIGISDVRIAKLTTKEIQGRKTIDGKGKIACPGFIDMHTHSPFPLGESFQVRDGATTLLDLESGAYPYEKYGFHIKDSARANFGASTAHAFARIKVIEGKDQPYITSEELEALVPGKAFVQKATPEQIEQMRKLIDEDLKKGGIGIGLLLDYMSPAVSNEELQMLFEVAKKNNVVIFAHSRRGINGDIKGLKELIDLSLKTGGAVHICHINANAMGNVGNWLTAIDAANKKGADISAEVFPYTAGSTSISADVFNRDWQTIFNITYKDVQWAETGEWFTKESWEDKRKNVPNGMVIHHYMKDEWVKTALKYPNMIVASDGMPAITLKVKSNPNLTSCYTRLLTFFVRDEKTISLNEAIAMSSYYPAKRLESFAPAFKKKGRIQEGADADVLIFNLDKLKVNATYTDPYKASAGWDYIIVNGQIAVENDKLTNNRAGKRITAK
ncbi:D-glutamate deacylase [Flavobacteriaceae bacterium]